MSYTHKLTLDFETASMCDLKKSGAHRYAQDPTTEVLVLSWSLRTMAGKPVRRGRWVPGEDDGPLVAFLSDPTVLLVAHNSWFEWCIYQEICRKDWGWPPVTFERFHDTMAVCAQKALPMKLEKVQATLKLPGKDMEGSKLTIGLSKPLTKADAKTRGILWTPGTYDRTPATLERVGEYCDRDVFVEEVLDDAVGWQVDGEREVWLLDQKINWRGVRLNMDYVAACKQVVAGAMPAFDKEFRDLTGVGMTQGVKFTKWLHDQGTLVPNLKKDTITHLLGLPPETEDGEDSDMDFDEAEIENVRLTPETRRALEIRAAAGSSSIKKLDRMQTCVSYDGRARGLLQYHGAGPGRWAGRLLQPQNFPVGTVKLDEELAPAHLVFNAIMTGDHEYVQAVLGPPIEAVVGGLRHAIQADRGNLLLAGDYASIEARIVLALAGQYDKCAILAAGKDIYIDMAQQIFKRVIDKLKDPWERKIGKNAVLGLGFRMAWATFQRRYGKDLTEEFLREVVRVYREEWAPRVPQLWYGLQDAALAAVETRRPQVSYGCEFAMSADGAYLTIRLPSGRRLWYPKAQATTRANPWTGEPEACWVYLKKGIQWVYMHGGIITENIVQALARDIMKHAMLTCEREGLPLILTVHDELIVEHARPDRTMLEQIMLDTQDWVRELKIPVGVEVWKEPSPFYHK